MTNFEAYCGVISSIIFLLFLKSANVVCTVKPLGDEVNRRQNIKERRRHKTAIYEVVILCLLYTCT